MINKLKRTYREVLDNTRLNFYTGRENLDKLILFFNTHSDENRKWAVAFSGENYSLLPIWVTSLKAECLYMIVKNCGGNIVEIGTWLGVLRREVKK